MQPDAVIFQNGEFALVTENPAHTHSALQEMVDQYISDHWRHVGRVKLAEAPRPFEPDIQVYRILSTPALINCLRFLLSLLMSLLFNNRLRLNLIRIKILLDT